MVLLAGVCSLFMLASPESHIQGSTPSSRPTELRIEIVGNIVADNYLYSFYNPGVIMKQFDSVSAEASSKLLARKAVFDHQKSHFDTKFDSLSSSAGVSSRCYSDGVYYVTVNADYKYRSNVYVTREKSDIYMKIATNQNAFSLGYISSGDTFDEVTFQDTNFAPKSPQEYKEITDKYIRHLDVVLSSENKKPLDKLVIGDGATYSIGY